MRKLTYEETMILDQLRVLARQVDTKPGWVVAAAYDKFKWDAVFTDFQRIKNVAGWMDRKEQYPATE